MSATPQDGQRTLAGRLVKGPVGFREMLQRLGPTFIKIGQFLALRPDLVPQEYCDELMHLLDQVPPFQWAQARAILREELGQEPEEIFAYINPRPIAAGSLAQAHFARLKNGEPVAVKIQRPDIRARVDRDLRRARLIAQLLQVSNVGLFASPREIVQEVSSWMMEELDFKRELANMSRLYRLTAGSPYEVVPKPYPDLSSSRVLTAEYLRGVPVSEILVSINSGLRAETERVDRLGIDWDYFAANLVRATLRQMFDYQFFHADLHPGNLLVLPGEGIGYVDFGLCDSLDETVRKEQLRYMAAIYNNDIEQMFRTMTDLLIPSDATDVEAFRKDFMAETRTMFVRRQESEQGEGAERSPVAQWLIGIMRAARQHGYSIPTRILSMYRALLTAETVATRLSTRVNLRSVGREFFEELAVNDALRSLDPNSWRPVLLSVLSLWRDAPGQVQQLLSEMSEGSFTLRVNVTEAPKVNRARNRRARLLATTILSVGVALLLVRPQPPTPLGISLTWLLAAALALLYLLTYIQWRRLR